MIPGIWELTDYTVNTIGNKAIPVIWSYQNRARTEKSYIILDYTNNDIPDFEVIDQPDENGFRQIASWRKATVDMQFYCGPDSMKIANYVAMAFATEKILDKQVELNVSIGTRLFFARVPALLNSSQYEDRAIYQFDFYYLETMGEEVGLIETVIIDGTYPGGNDTTTASPPGEGNLTTLTCHEEITLPVTTQ